MDPHRSRKTRHPPSSAAWRVAKTIRPEQPGAVKLTRAHGDRLVCVRYREHPDGGERITTVELVVDRVVIQRRKDEIVSFKIKATETDLQRIAKSKGAIYDSTTRMWKLSRTEVLRMGLRKRIAMPIDGLD